MQLSFLWTRLNNLLGPCVFSPMGALHPLQAAGRLPVASPLDIWEEHMDYVWIRVVTPEWEYTQRLDV